MGRTCADVTEFGPNPTPTVFEWLNHFDEFHGRVAVYGKREKRSIEVSAIVLADDGEIAYFSGNTVLGSPVLTV
jgi:hypothetical protein